MTPERSSSAESAPSQLRGGEPILARYAGGLGWGLVVVGVVAVLANRWAESPRFVPTGWGWLFVVVGVVLALVHSAVETDLLLRRVLGLVGAALVVAGVVLALVHSAVETDLLLR